ncbi:hypothetical protein VM95_13935 [Streptomyces rubellomurinus]|uniref:Uncharacterized protein n=1 Tax=Streptomyces rubellomurinus (strain ATCC 31215) TaxID=359131 RepID=A0A0F2TGK0_STRR3|nr:hypothetical protein VM95_13935 [Streptomyces rubellomurinus]
MVGVVDGAVGRDGVHEGGAVLGDEQRQAERAVQGEQGLGQAGGVDRPAHGGDVLVGEVERDVLGAGPGRGRAAAVAVVAGEALAARQMGDDGRVVVVEAERVDRAGDLGEVAAVHRGGARS